MLRVNTILYDRFLMVKGMLRLRDPFYDIAVFLSRKFGPAPATIEI